MSLVAKGGRALSDDIAQALAVDRLAQPQSWLAELGPRETEILRLLASAWDDEAIAEELHLSLKTVRNYHYQIRAKLGARTDAHLVWLALEAGLVETGPVQCRSSSAGWSPPR